MVVGVSEYKHAGKLNLSSLRYADADARAVARFLSSPNANFDRVVVLTNEQATRQAIADAMSGGLRDVAPEDVVVLFFSGHGVPDPFPPRRFYFLPYDADPADLPNTGYPLDDLLARPAAGRLIVLLDTCHSGALTNTRDIVITKRTKQLPVGAIRAAPEYLSPYDRAEQLRTLILTSCGSDESAHEGPQWILEDDPDDGHGVFTWALIKGLRGEADADDDQTRE